MTAFYVIPPQSEYSGSIIISTDGVGYSRREVDGNEYRLVSVMVHMSRNNNAIYTTVFEHEGDLYECCRTFKRVDGRPAVRVNGELKPAPNALIPFADSRTKVRSLS